MVRYGRYPPEATIIARTAVSDMDRVWEQSTLYSTATCVQVVIRFGSDRNRSSSAPKAR